MINGHNLSRDYGSEILVAQLGAVATISLGGAEQEQQQALMCSQRQMVWAFNS